MNAIASSWIISGRLLQQLALLAALLSISPARTTGYAQSSSGSLRAGELKALVDRLVPEQLTTNRVPGAVVAVVQDGGVVLSEAYGFADVDARVPARADTTLFRPGSITKLLTWTAALQLVDEGRLRLDADVNTYLDTFKVPATFEQPITLAHLMTHTAGFEERWIGIFVRQAEDLEPLSAFLSRTLPVRVRPPGQLAAYSNYGAMLAALIIERVSGMPYETYVRERILVPLGMSHTTFQQPPPAQPGITMAKPYADVNGALVARGFEFVQAIPAGGLSTTASDMAKFMLGMQRPASDRSASILSESGRRLMQETQFSLHPGMPGLTAGFVERPGPGPRVIWHPGGGGAMAFTSVLALVPEERLGIYASYNSAGGAAAREALLDAILDFFHPDRRTSSAAQMAAAPDARASTAATAVDGTYRIGQHTQRTIEKLTGLTQLTVSDEPDGTLTVRGLSPAVSHWTAIDALRYRRVGGSETVAFGKDAAGRVQYLTWSGAPAVGFERVAWYETTALHTLLLLFCVATFGLEILVWCSRVLLRRFRMTTREEPRRVQLARRAAVVTSALSLGVLIALLVLLLGRTEQTLAYGVSPALVAVLAIALLVPAGFALVGVFAVMSWTSSLWSMGARLHYAIVATAGGAFVWWLHYWNLLGFKY